MQLHHQSVVGAHPRHLDQHVAGEAYRVVAACLIPQRALKQHLGVAVAEMFGIGG